MGFNYNDALSAFLILFAVIDILGSIPIIVTLRKKVGQVQSEKATLVAGAIMIVFLFLGERILHLLGVDVQSFAIAGSFVLFFLALEMILGITLYKEESPNTASIVPIAFPMIAGAGTMTSLVSLRAEFATINIIIAIVLNMVVVYAVLKNTERIERILGSGGLSILRKVFGVILLAIAVKLFFANLIPLLQNA
ncbi:MAG: MarC family protein [Schleiferiaceae bacterium]|jgi:multiple antibiotic resistance protein|nr:MarC family protein [Schleiferiaceae bacterium]MDG1313430.1 MarC family protein [Schleiferiaceae bacterium]MDG1917883.1 MarC family protein [Schleiferiaceae bacterium]MDG2109713.1 MarC family protein [Schleiferiaceae bacterium]